MIEYKQEKTTTRQAKVEEKNRKIGLLGGTFDPVHLGHVRMAEACKEKLCLDEVWWIPASVPPHKNRETTPYETRRTWISKALKGKSGHSILDIENEREGKSYTYHTLLELHRREPNCQFYFLTGADSLEQLHTWYHWEDILDLCVFVVTTRPGYDMVVPDIVASVAQKSKGGILRVDIDALDVSSTEVRERVARKQAIEELIPEAIVDEVKESMEIKVEGYKEILKNRLSVKRYTHSVGVANTAARLAGMFNGNIEKAYLAGLMHDYARELSEEELLELTAKHDLSTDGVELMQTSLLHGPVGAWLLEQEGLITDKQVLDAIRWHTTGHPDMDQLARIIYISDYIEPGRNFPGVDMLRQITNKDLNLGVLAGLDHTLGFLVQRNNFIHPLSIAARNRLLEEHVVEELS